MKDLSFKYNGETFYLPTWYQLESEEEIEGAKAALIAEMIRSDSAEPTEFVEDEYDAELDRMTEMEEYIWNQLKAEGYTSDQIEEILARYYSGQTLDSAMQSVI